MRPLPSSAAPSPGEATAPPRSRRLVQIIVSAMLGFGVSAASDLSEDDWTNITVHVPTLLALSGALWAWARGRQQLASAVLLATTSTGGSAFPLRGTCGGAPVAARASKNMTPIVSCAQRARKPCRCRPTGTLLLKR